MIKDLPQLIRSRDNWLSHELFMQTALHMPEVGYYSSNIEDIGLRGDFSTAATMSDILAKAILAEWKQACKLAGMKLPIIEVGAGNGALAQKILSKIGFFKQWMINYHIVESSPRLRDYQNLFLGNQVKVHDDIKKALKKCRGKAFIFSNELVDAFAVRILEFRNDEWLEVGLTTEGNQIKEELRPLTRPSASSMIDFSAPEGQRIEVHDSYYEWLQSWISDWQLGSFITIDYGNEMEELYHRNPKGTMRAYWKHQLFRNMDVYQCPGMMDLTCDVNFSDLIYWAKKHQIIGETINLCSQREFLLPHTSHSEQDSFLTNPYGAGEYFQVLKQDRYPNNI